jgi:hypothetical protein
MVPFRRSRGSSSIDCFKPVIINKMKLRRNVATAKVADKPDSLRMDW